ncbi:CGNR zinc finger domain-containing protein [Sphaerisporangium perillae]|uniref:CGNR zinc finger domain-containing protein n=1 Tax=Sphaerisporangium perillae TaxID=2935860 RepID=UPI00200C2E0E|nr:CGNR zinc finger domain-containing protein [Sphaerisporangium perillae]
MNFNSHSDTVVAIAAALVNTLTAGEARGRAYAPPPEGPALRAAVTDALSAGGRRTREATDEEAAELTGVAAELRVVFDAVEAGDVDAAAGQVNRVLDRTQARPHLERHDGEPWHLHFHGRSSSTGDDYAAACATGLAIVLGGELYDRLGVCTAPHCDRVFVDTSRNGTRRFCSTPCQNRVKTAAFRARTQQP